MRLAPESAAKARGELQGGSPRIRISQALRFALGEDVKVRDGELSGAAKRMRELCGGRLRAVPVESRVAVIRERQDSHACGGGFRQSLRRTTIRCQRSARTVRKLPAGTLVPTSRLWVASTKAASYIASLLPADLELLFADGASAAQPQPRLVGSTMGKRGLSTPAAAFRRAGETDGYANAGGGARGQGAQGRPQSRSTRWCTRRRKGGSMSRCSAPTSVSACGPIMPPGARYAKSLRAALRIDAGVAAPLSSRSSSVSIEARPEDPPKDTAALLELLLELGGGSRFEIAWRDSRGARRHGIRRGGKAAAGKAADACGVRSGPSQDGVSDEHAEKQCGERSDDHQRQAVARKLARARWRSASTLREMEMQTSAIRISAPAVAMPRPASTRDWLSYRAWL